MSTLVQDDPEVTAAMNNKAVTALMRYAPVNKADYHDEAEDEKLVEYAQKQASWIKSITAKAEELM